MKLNYLVLAGFLLLLIIVASYFIPITQEQEVNQFIKEQSTTPLLGILIFHNPFILGIYVFIAIILIIFGIISNNSFKHS
jgi:hypothetical protein